VASYQITLRDGYGNQLDVIESFIRLEWARSENQIGVMHLDMPRSNAEQFYAKDIKLEIWRTLGTKTYLEGNTQWFLRDWKLSSQAGLKTWHLTAYDGNYLLEGREVEYASDSAQAKKTAAIDDMQKAIIRENMGSLATDTTRDITAFVQVQADMTLAPSTTKVFSRRNVLNVLTELAQESYQRGTYLTFDVQFVSPGLLEFRTFTGQQGVNHNRSSLNPVIINEQRSSLVNPTLEWDYTNEVTVVTAGGQGQGAERVTVTVTDPVRLAESPFSRREVFRDAVQAGVDLAAIEAEARTALIAGRPLRILTGSIQDFSAWLLQSFPGLATLG